MRDSGRLRLVLALLFLFSISLLAIGIRSGEAGLISALRSSTLQITGPVQSGATSLGETFRVVAENLSRVTSRDDQLKALQVENEELKFKLSQSADLRRKAVALDQLLRIVPPQNYKVIPAQVTAIGNTGDFRWTITVDAGSIDGVTLNTTVVSGTGLVGRIVQVNDNYSIASLLIDPNVKVGVRLEGSAEIGFISGTGVIDKLSLQLFDPYAKMPIGARVISWGSDTGKPYMPGLAIGRIASVEGSAGQLNRTATVIPSADISNLEIVGLVLSAKRDVLRDPLKPQGD
ncbi:MAG: rod shape-determining protein MreC [Actinomycetota bacterium]|nr:rod shape-determining protein MreC [Actinomycetota bacterium]